VNFFALSFWGNRYGLYFSGLTEQSFFLRALGFVSYLAAIDDSEENKKFAASLLINEMGKRFKVLIQRKNIPQTTLRGMIFQRPLNKWMFPRLTG
jgi:SAM-dependent MidA family methyltransferase